MNYDFSNEGFPKIFSDIVARAAMVLPPLTRSDDGQFLVGMAGKLNNAFWNEYVGALPYAVQSDLLLAIQKRETDAILLWYGQFANFREDAEARQLATIILDELSEQLPGLIKEEYDSFHSVSPVSV